MKVVAVRLRAASMKRRALQTSCDRTVWRFSAASRGAALGRTNSAQTGPSPIDRRPASEDTGFLLVRG